MNDNVRAHIYKELNIISPLYTGNTLDGQGNQQTVTILKVDMDKDHIFFIFNEQAYRIVYIPLKLYQLFDVLFTEFSLLLNHSTDVNFWNKMIGICNGNPRTHKLMRSKMVIYDDITSGVQNYYY